jgi:hypothetical protein
MSRVLPRSVVWWLLVSRLSLLWLPAITAVAQDVDFANDRPFTIQADRDVYFSDGTPVVGTHFLAQLYYGVSANSLTPVLAPPRTFRDVPVTDPLAGTWFRTPRFLTGFSPGNTVILEVRVWDGAIAPTYEEAAAVNFLGTQHGTSATFTYTIPPIGPPGSAWYMENLRSFTLVPEPAVVALTVVGIGGLLLLKRRK